MRKRSKSKKRLPIILRGKCFSPKDQKTIDRYIRRYFNRGRTYISIAICKELNWKQPNGWLKDRACRDVLLQMEERGLITLPPRHTSHKKDKLKPQRKASHIATYDLVSPITEFPRQIHLVLAKGNQAEKVWNEIVNRHHYLGHKVVVGRCIKYLVEAEDKLLGAVAFSSPAWNLAPRDTLLPALGIDPLTRHDQIINNSRFLVLPNVQVYNLASTILSLATDKIVLDWTNYYSVTPLVAETFVQPSLYYGTCYKAANWLQVGATKGYAKVGPAHHNSQEPKQIFLYGLNKYIRRKLLKAVRDASGNPIIRGEI